VSKKSVLEQAKELLKAAKDNPEQFQELSKKYLGFKAVENKAKESGARDPGAVAAAVGRKKYGKEAFQHAAATGHKMNKEEMNQRKAALRDGKITKEEYAEPVGGQISSESTTAGYPSDQMKKDTMNPAGEAQGGDCGPDSPGAGYPSEQMKKDAMHPHAQPVKKDDQPHPAGSPRAEAHNVAEGDESLHHAMKILDTPDKQKAMLSHLRTLHEPSQLRSPQNRVAGGVPPHKPNASMNKVDMPGTSIAGAGNAGPLAMSETLTAVRDLLKIAKEDPKRFEELRKMSSVAGLATSEKKTAKTSEMGLALAERGVQPNPNTMDASKISPSTGIKTGGTKDPNSATQPKTAEQISPCTSVKPGGVKDPNSATQPMTESQINASSTKKGEMGTKKCGVMMTKDEIKEDMKQDWKPRHWKKKDC